MELGPYTLQVFTSLVLILGAACVALICDFLKGNNEQLRELTIELKVRREEEHKRIELMIPRMFTAPHGAIAPGTLEGVPTATPSTSEAGISRREHTSRSLAAPQDRKRTAAPGALAAMERGARLAGTPRASRVSAFAEAQGTSQTQTMPPPQSAEIAFAPSKPKLVEAPSGTESNPQRIPEQLLVEAMAASTATRQARSGPVSQQIISLRVPSKLVASKKDWNSLLAAKRTAASVPVTPESPLAAVMEATVSDFAGTGSPALPAGFRDGFVIAELISRKQPANGLVISIGVIAPQLLTGTVPERVHHLIESLLGPSDFATQSKPSEFLLIFPNERGAAAQRRLNQVAQKLWDFQLLSLETDPVMFGWGGLEVRNEPVNEAIASATERMQEARRGRKNQSTESPIVLDEPLRKAM